MPDVRLRQKRRGRGKAGKNRGKDEAAKVLSRGPSRTISLNFGMQARYPRYEISCAKFGAGIFKSFKLTGKRSIFAFPMEEQFVLTTELTYVRVTHIYGLQR